MLTGKSLRLMFLLFAALLVFFTHGVTSRDEKTCGSEDGQSKECQSPDGVDPTLLQKARDFGRFLEATFDVNDSYSGSSRTEQELLVLEAVFKHVDMDPRVLTTNTMSENWYHTLYTRLTALAPPDVFFTIYTGKPTDLQIKLVAAMDETAVKRANESQEMHASFEDKMGQEAFRRFRYRGGTTRQGRVFRMLVYNPLTYWVGFAVPNQAVLDRIANYSPLVEVGAGTGYWSAVLQQQGVDIVAYDSEPPTDQQDENVYFHHTYTTVLPGTCTQVFTEHPEYSNRALLIIWPNNPDNIDNKDFHSNSLPPVWDVDCLKAYMAVGGKTVVFVGEREENIRLIPGAPPESGMTATRQYQNMLKEQFELAEKIHIPQWWCSDDATIWKRR